MPELVSLVNVIDLSKDIGKALRVFPQLLPPVTGRFRRGTGVLPDKEHITNLFADQSLLQEDYERAAAVVRRARPDCSLNGFHIAVMPFVRNSSIVFIVFVFYSELAQMYCSMDMAYGDHSKSVGQMSEYPGKQGSHVPVFERPPWMTSPHWQPFLDQAYRRLPMSLSQHPRTSYILYAQAGKRLPWGVRFCEGTSGQEWCFGWDGETLGSKAIVSRRLQRSL